MNLFINEIIYCIIQLRYIRRDYRTILVYYPKNAVQFSVVAIDFISYYSCNRYVTFTYLSILLDI